MKLSCTFNNAPGQAAGKHSTGATMQISLKQQLLRPERPVTSTPVTVQTCCGGCWLPAQLDHGIVAICLIKTVCFVQQGPCSCSLQGLTGHLSLPITAICAQGTPCSCHFLSCLLISLLSAFESVTGSSSTLPAKPSLMLIALVNGRLAERLSSTPAHRQQLLQILLQIFYHRSSCYSSVGVRCYLWRTNVWDGSYNVSLNAKVTLANMKS